MQNEERYDDNVEQNNTEDLYQDQGPPLSKNQKIAVAVLAVFAFFVIIFWMVSFNQNLKNSFNYGASSNVTEDSNNTDNNGEVKPCAGGDCANKEDERLRNQDTDEDGLSDWDELNVYITSPYLADSDSDGIKDGEEINTGTDPNCPTGAVCNKIETDSQNSNSSTVDQEIENLIGGSVTSTSTSSLNNSGTQINPSSVMPDAKTLRAALIQAGFDKDLLDQATDAELLQIYAESLKSTQSSQ